MTEEEYRVVIAKYQQKSFELFNQNIVLEAQIEQLQKIIDKLKEEYE